MENKNFNRRQFLSCGAMIGAAGMVAPAILSSCGGGAKEETGYTPLKAPGEYYVPELPDKADDGRELKVGLVGCGGRGSGAVENLLEAGLLFHLLKIGLPRREAGLICLAIFFCVVADIIHRHHLKAVAATLRLKEGIHLDRLASVLVSRFV